MKTRHLKLAKPSTIKKMGALPDENKTCKRLSEGNCGVFNTKVMRFCLVFFLMLTFIAMPLLYSNDNLVYADESSVMAAYELRISGKADEAEAMLNEILKNDSTDALAYFELARTKQHLFLGGQEISWDEVVNAGSQAVRYAPEDVNYAFYYAYTCLFNSYISLMRQQPNAGEMLARTCDAFQAVLNLDPVCREALLYLVDIYGVLPEDMGGDRGKAEIYASELENKDKLYGAMAYSRLLPESADNVSYWEDFSKEAGANAQVLEELGRAYLFQSDTENGTKYYQEAIQADVTKRYLYMHLVRYHILSTQQNPDLKGEHMEKAEELANNYLHSSPELIPPLKAYAYGILALIKNIGGDNSGRDEDLEMAASVDPYYSKGMGIPMEMIYSRPDEVKIQYSSFFLPF